MSSICLAGFNMCYSLLFIMAGSFIHCSISTNAELITLEIAYITPNVSTLSRQLSNLGKRNSKQTNKQTKPHLVIEFKLIE